MSSDVDVERNWRRFYCSKILLRQAIEKLPDKERHVIQQLLEQLHERGRYSIQEVADELGEAYSTVWERVQKAFQNLRADLSQNSEIQDYLASFRRRR